MENKKIIIGDAIAIAIVTLIGFATHGEMRLTYLSRMAASFFPVVIGWFLLAPWFGLFDDAVVNNKKLLWRVPLAMMLSAPFAGILRAAILGSSALPVFVFILGVTNAMGMVVWRWARSGK